MLYSTKTIFDNIKMNFPFMLFAVHLAGKHTASVIMGIYHSLLSGLLATNFAGHKNIDRL